MLTIQCILYLDRNAIFCYTRILKQSLEPDIERSGPIYTKPRAIVYSDALVVIDRPEVHRVGVVLQIG